MVFIQPTTSETPVRLPERVTAVTFSEASRLLFLAYLFAFENDDGLALENNADLMVEL